MWAAVCQMTRCSGSGIAVLWEMGDVSSTHQLPELSGNIFDWFSVREHVISIIVWKKSV